MTIERDSRLQKLFDAARQDLTGEVFVAEVTSQIDSQRRRAIFRWICLGLALAAAACLLTPPITEAVLLLVQVLPRSLIELDHPNELLGQVLAPLNSIAVPVAVGALGLWVAYRKIF